MTDPNTRAEPVAITPVNLDDGVMEIQEVRYSLPQILRELQIERTKSFFAKEIIDQIEISKIFDQARKARARRKKQ